MSAVSSSENRDVAADTGVADPNAAVAVALRTSRRRREAAGS